MSLNCWVDRLLDKGLDADAAVWLRPEPRLGCISAGPADDWWGYSRYGSGTEGAIDGSGWGCGRGDTVGCGCGSGYGFITPTGEGAGEGYSYGHGHGTHAGEGHRGAGLTLAYYLKPHWSP